MPRIWKRHCDNCHNYYESSAKRFCSLKCRNQKRIGFRHSEKTKIKIGNAHKGKIVSAITRIRQSRTRKRIYKTGKAVIWCKGLTSKTDKRIAIRSENSRQARILKGSHRGAKNFFWRGGVSKVPYTSDWWRISRAYRQLILHCELCGKKGRDVHHKDMNKKNNNKDNLMLLCRKCHLAIHCGSVNIIK